MSKTCVYCKTINDDFMEKCERCGESLSDKVATHKIAREFKIGYEEKARKPGRACLVISLLLGIVYFLGFLIYCAMKLGQTTDFLAGVTLTLVAPHIFMVMISVGINFLAAFRMSKGLAITSGVLYLVAGLLLWAYFYFVLPMIALCFIGMARIPDRR